jgi:hypothetical protein
MAVSRIQSAHKPRGEKQLSQIRAMGCGPALRLAAVIHVGVSPPRAAILGAAPLQGSFEPIAVIQDEWVSD